MRQHRRPSPLATTVIVSLLSVSLLAACGDDTTAPAETTADTSEATAPSSTGLPGDSEWPKPSVSIPTALPTELVVTTLTDGSGDAATEGSTVIVHYVGVRSESGQEFDNSYDRGEPFPVVLGAGQVIQGWDQGLIGVQAGERRQLDIPADLAYGDSPQGDVIQAGDALTFVVDVVAVLPASSADDQPDVTVEARENVEALSIEDVVVGEGAPLAEGQHAAIQIILFRADTGEELDSSWGSAPATFTVSDNSEIFPIFVEAVRGMNVGGRRLAQMPFTEVWDGAGNENLGLPTGVDLVVAIDLVGSY
ncbi:MAG: FKBP-type peptidyl-prolyl cis-trans isomerase [Ilumatobacteraceae bacterium]